MKCFLFFAFIIIFTSPVLANPDSLLNLLSKTINKARLYDTQKENQIYRLKQSLYDAGNHNLQKLYAENTALYEEYKLFKYDSAYQYASRLINIAAQTGNAEYMTDAKLKLSFILLSSGLFTETFDLLQTIHIKSSSDSIKADYYTLLGRYYYDLATYDLDKHYSLDYDKKGSLYIDSALLYYSPTSFEYNYYKGLRLYKESSVDSAASFFENLMKRTNLSYHQLALTASTLSNIYLQRNNTDEGMQLLARAAMADIKSSNKETFAVFNLAELLYKEGDVIYASQFIETAIDNANDYGARQRKMQVSGILPLIEQERIKAVESQNRLLIQYGVVATVLLVSLITLILVVRKQVKKLKAAKQIITEAHSFQQKINKMLDETVKKLEHTNIQLEAANHQLEDANIRLANSNMKLEEANIIKEECVSYFFNIDSEFFSKLERLKTILEKKISEKKLDEVRYIVNNINLRQEKENLLHSFDKVFLRIYPNFIECFNTFFRPEDKVHLHGSDMLNSDLRIFALIRMGITDSDKIARILGYSVNTIYTYKTKIKNRSVVPKEEFEERLMGIKSA